MWQDWIVSIMQWVFILSLLPTIFSTTQKPPISTSLVSGVGMWVLSATYFTLNLTVSTFSSFLLGALWIVVAYQRHRLNTKENEKAD